MDTKLLNGDDPVRESRAKKLVRQLFNVRNSVLLFWLFVLVAITSSEKVMLKVTVDSMAPYAYVLAQLIALVSQRTRAQRYAPRFWAPPWRVFCPFSV